MLAPSGDELVMAAVRLRVFLPRAQTYPEYDRLVDDGVVTVAVAACGPAAFGRRARAEPAVGVRSVDHPGKPAFGRMPVHFACRYLADFRGLAGRSGGPGTTTRGGRLDVDTV